MLQTCTYNNEKYILARVWSPDRVELVHPLTGELIYVRLDEVSATNTEHRETVPNNARFVDRDPAFLFTLRQRRLSILAEHARKHSKPRGKRKGSDPDDDFGSTSDTDSGSGKRASSPRKPRKDSATVAKLIHNSTMAKLESKGLPPDVLAKIKAAMEGNK